MIPAAKERQKYDGYRDFRTRNISYFNIFICLVVADLDAPRHGVYDGRRHLLDVFRCLQHGPFIYLSGRYWSIQNSCSKKTLSMLCTKRKPGTITDAIVKAHLITARSFLLL